MRIETKTLTPALVARMVAGGTAADGLPVGQTFLHDNPARAFAAAKPMPLGHGGANPTKQDYPAKSWRIRLALFVGTTMVVVPLPSQAVPSFARQMNMQCIACHTEYPVLTEFGRQFKLGGYTLSTGQDDSPPFAVMLQPSFTHTQAAQPVGAHPGSRTTTISR